MKKVMLGILLALLISVMVVPLASAAPPASNGYWYTVQYGDNLTRIAYRYGVTVHQIVHANHLSNPNYIYAGQKLWIPSTEHHDSGHDRYHTVQYGETVSSIAYHYGVSVWAIGKANDLYNLNYIYAGQKLVIPYGY